MFIIDGVLDDRTADVEDIQESLFIPEDVICTICRNKAVRTVFNPYNHLICESCAKRVKRAADFAGFPLKCPSCRTVSTGYDRVSLTIRKYHCKIISLYYSF